MPGKTAQDNTSYQAYFVRIWCEATGNHAQIVWRCSLKDVTSGRRRGFENLQAMFAFLEGAVAEQNEGVSHDQDAQ